MTPRQARANGVSAPNGALVVSDLATDGPAVRAGLERGDLLLGTPDGVLPRNLHAVIRARKPGDEIVLRVLRAGRERLVTLTLGTRPR
jgi:putative serine protease PepD